MIRKADSADIERIREITMICFDGVSIDQNIEMIFGKIGELNWKQRKVRHIDEDYEAEGEIFVAEQESKIVGYITTKIDRCTKIGCIPNFAVLPEYQKQGIGKCLIQKALDYFRSERMLLAQIETLEQNKVGMHFYPKIGFKETAKKIYYAKLL